jgi:hypothetical protein
VACSVTVIAIDADLTRRLLEPSWFPLTPDAPGSEAYGLYSYLLIGSVPTAHMRPTVLRAIEAYIGYASYLVEMRRYVKDSTRINATAIFVRTVPPAVTPETVLENYDFAAARAVIARISGLERDGLYIVSSLGPLHPPDTPRADPLAIQDLTRMPPTVVGLWVREFLSQTSAEQQWNPPQLRRLVLNLRTTIAVVAAHFPVERRRIRLEQR